MWGTIETRGSRVSACLTVKRSAVGGLVAALVALMVGPGAATADTHTGFVLEITCGTTTTTVVSPTDPAAASQDVSGHGVIILSYGALLAPDHFPAGKVEYCDIFNETTGNTFTDLPFLLQGAP
jgi:hypothetical protein